MLLWDPLYTSPFLKGNTLQTLRQEKHFLLSAPDSCVPKHTHVVENVYLILCQICLMASPPVSPTGDEQSCDQMPSGIFWELTSPRRVSGDLAAGLKPPSPRRQGLSAPPASPLPLEAGRQKGAKRKAQGGS